MQELGDMLKTAREEKGLTLRDIERATKIGIRLLEHIEAGDFHKLPKGVFARNFVRQYCEFIDLDAEPVVAEAFGMDAEPEQQESSTGTSRQTFSGWPVVLIVLVLLIVVALWVWPGWLRTTGKDNSVTRSELQSSESTDSDQSIARRKDAGQVGSQGEPQPPEVIEEELIDNRTGDGMTGEQAGEFSQASGVQNQPTGTNAVLPETEGQPEQNDADLVLPEGSVAILEFRVADRCWVHLRCPQRDMDFMLEANEVYTINCGYPVVLTLGNAPVVTLTVNGQPVDFPGDQQVLRNFTIQAPDEGTRP